MVSDSSVSAKNLMDGGLCPPWWVPSKPLMGRCVPFFYQVKFCKCKHIGFPVQFKYFFYSKKDSGGKNMTDSSVVVEAVGTADATDVTGSVLLQATKKVFLSPLISPFF